MHNELLYIGVLCLTPLLGLLIVAAMIPAHMKQYKEPTPKELLAGLGFLALAFIGAILVSLSFIAK